MRRDSQSYRTPANGWAEEIEAQIAKSNPSQDPESLRQAISSAHTDKSEELRYRLRQEILRRVSKIDFDFGTGGLVVFIRFVNGADRMIDFLHLREAINRRHMDIKRSCAIGLLGRLMVSVLPTAR